MTDYNGWTNYATWRVQLEVVDDYVNNECADDYESIKTMTASEWREDIEGFVENVLEAQADESSLVYGYAMAFLQDVNWQELGEHAEEYAKTYKG